MSTRDSLDEMMTVALVRDGELAVRLEDFFGESIGGDVLGRATRAAATGVWEGLTLHAPGASLFS
jgi:hypothetical protein